MTLSGAIALLSIISCIIKFSVRKTASAIESVYFVPSEEGRNGVGPDILLLHLHVTWPMLRRLSTIMLIMLEAMLRETVIIVSAMLNARLMTLHVMSSVARGCEDVGHERICPTKAFLYAVLECWRSRSRCIKIRPSSMPGTSRGRSR